MNFLLKLYSSVKRYAVDNEFADSLVQVMTEFTVADDNRLQLISQLETRLNAKSMECKVAKEDLWRTNEDVKEAVDRLHRSEKELVQVRQSRDQFRGQVEHIRLKHDKLEQASSAMKESYKEKLNEMMTKDANCQRELSELKTCRQRSADLVEQVAVPSLGVVVSQVGVVKCLLMNVALFTVELSVDSSVVD